uniref:Uncharacterized protein n=1 Tax=Tetranychus urticae TaxID=32264 RepID=T1K328_TETUR
MEQRSMLKVTRLRIPVSCSKERCFHWNQLKKPKQFEYRSRNLQWISQIGMKELFFVWSISIKWWDCQSTKISVERN